MSQLKLVPTYTAWWTEARACKHLAQGCYVVAHRPGGEPATFRSRIRCPTIEPLRQAATTPRDRATRGEIADLPLHLPYRLYMSLNTNNICWPYGKVFQGKKTRPAVSLLHNFSTHMTSRVNKHQSYYYWFVIVFPLHCILCSLFQHPVISITAAKNATENNTSCRASATQVT